MWFFFCTSPEGMAYVLPRERHCWINHQAFLTNETLLSILYKWRLFSWKERCFSSKHHTTHAGSSCLEACEQLRFFSGNAVQITLQVSSVADGTTETSCKQVTVPFGGTMKPSGKCFWKLSCPVLVFLICILASGCWAFWFLCPCHPRAFLFLGTAAEQYPDKLQMHLLTCAELRLGQQPGHLPKRTAMICLSLQ